MADVKRKGIVTRGHGNRFIVLADEHSYECQILKKVKFNTEKTTPVAVGDDVRIIITGEETGAIEKVYKRKRVLSRPEVGREDFQHVLAANIDALVIVVSTKAPKLKPGLIDRFLIAAQIGNLKPAIVINKVDLRWDKEIEEVAQVYRSLGYELFLTSAMKNPGLNEIDQFREYLSRHRSILAGHSGVGKSSLLNCLFPGLNLKVSDISHASGKGRHTTSYLELFQLPGGGYVIDSPGIKVLGLWQLEKENLADYYPEMVKLSRKCRFSGCSHIHEPDCAIKLALEKGRISAMRYVNYVAIYNSL